uniref:RRM domain-containing protein n=1 Tax=Saimiri boliviensis boliviensis TaxID=39432 RepID=A0A2K6SA40_SAIBB
MNPLTKVKMINELNEQEFQLGVADKVSWHFEYKDSAWIFLGGIPCELTEGDIMCVFSQYGEIVNINLVSTILAFDNFTGIKIKGRTILVDHVSNYRAPKDSEEMDDVTRELQEKGSAVRTPSPSWSESSEDEKPTKKHTHKKRQKQKKAKEKTDWEVQAEQASSSSRKSKTVKEENDPGPKKHSSRNLERAQKSEPREGRKLPRTAYSGAAEDLERELKKGKPRQEHKSSSRREAREEKSRDRDRGRTNLRCRASHTRVKLKGVSVRHLCNRPDPTIQIVREG